jgi:phosphoglycolate phosphatase
VKLAKPQAVLFDWDNTLIDNFGAIRHALNAAFRAFGLPEWTIEETHARVRRSLRESFPEIFGAEWQRARSIFYKAFEDGHLDAMKVCDGAAELLDAMDVTLAVVSNKQGKLLRREADHLGWTAKFHRLVGASDAARDKPDRAPFDMAMEGLEIPLGPQVWYVGDTGLDMQAAHAISGVPILVGNGMGDDALLLRYPPALRVPDLRALRAVWRELGL